MGDEVDSTSGTGFSLGYELSLDNYYLDGFCLSNLREDQDDHVPYPLLSPGANNPNNNHPMCFDREYSNTAGGGVHGSSDDGWSAVSGALSFTTTYGPDLDEQQLTVTPPGVAEVAVTQQQQYSQKMDNSTKHHLSCGTHPSSLDSDSYDTASSDSNGEAEVQQQSKTKTNGEVSFRAPELDMEFSSEEEAYKFYKDYAKVIGFSKLMAENVTPLEFAHKYQHVAKEQRRYELDEDSYCNETTPLMILKGSALEKQAADVYTCTMFKLFQEELRGCLSVAIEDMGSNGGVAAFKLKEEGEKDRIVKLCDSLNQIACSCQKYESYILKRWTKSAKHEKVPNDKIGVADRSQKSLKVRKLMQKALTVITKSVAVEEGYKIVEDCLDKVLGKVENVLKRKLTKHQEIGKDVEILCTSNGGMMETQTVVSAPPFQNEVAEHRIRNKSKRKHEDDASEISCKSMDDGVLHRQLPKKATKGKEEASTGCASE
ncbi:hypothetical protein COLO4_24540 [Corchorus olitorius]|uniref:Protein FAR1-RELATED SEQUENCE n=1 Tax=Corchorus olitorius TaxID=93759 RepID=A0A1R3I9E3_9ROSI|nr:hypothetical protein COLO4_24540 [Corchorus olitorius]